jgi:hypothetical protein
MVEVHDDGKSPKVLKEPHGGKKPATVEQVPMAAESDEEDDEEDEFAGDDSLPGDEDEELDFWDESDWDYLSY